MKQLEFPTQLCFQSSRRLKSWNFEKQWLFPYAPHLRWVDFNGKIITQIK